MLAFAVPAALAAGAIQPLFGAAVGVVPVEWALQLSAPALMMSGMILIVGRLGDDGADLRQPPAYSAWLLLPGAFLLAGAAAMCLIGALIQFGPVREAGWALLAAGAGAWVTGLTLVRRWSR